MMELSFYSRASIKSLGTYFVMLKTIFVLLFEISKIPIKTLLLDYRLINIFTHKSISSVPDEKPITF